jgi:hypothetical protein
MCQGRAAVKPNSRRSTIDIEGSTWLPAAYEGADLYQIELAMALIDGKLGTAKEISTAWEKLVAYGVSEESLRKLGFTKPAV